jgi:phytoene desaturase
MKRPERAIVVGAGVGGLSAAINLALRGYPVTVFESNEKPGGRANVIEFDGFKFDTGPSLLNYPWVFDDLFKAAGTSLEQELSLIRVDPAIKFYWPDGEEFQLSSDLTRLSAECRRLEPADGAGLFKFLEDARHKYRVSFDRLVTRNADSPLKWFSAAGPSNLGRLGLFRSMDSQIGKHFKSNRIREALGSYGMYLGGAPYDLRGIFSIIPFGELEYGLWLPEGGMYSLIEAMCRLAERVGVEIRTSSPARSIDIERQQVTGITLEDGSVEQAEIVVSNVDVPTTMTRLLSANQPTKTYKAPKMTPGVITYYIAVDRDLNELGHHTVYLPEDSRSAYHQLMREGVVPDDLPFYASVASNTDASLSPASSSALFLLAPVPLISQLGKVDLDVLSGELRQRMFERMRQHGVPISSSDIIRQETMTPVDWSAAFGLFDGSAFGAAHNLRQIGPFRSRNISSQFKGLFFTGASTTPGTGVPMCVLSGKMVAERIDDWIQKGGAAA